MPSPPSLPFPSPHTPKRSLTNLQSAVEMLVETLFWQYQLARWHSSKRRAQESKSFQHAGFLSMAYPGRMLAVVLHGILGCQNERRETGQRLRQLQERMLVDRVEKTVSSQCLMVMVCSYQTKTGSVTSAVMRKVIKK